jgi:hypothetical protein
MPRFFFSRRLTCFYCGSTSPQKYNGSIREFHCATCDAVNHLDSVWDESFPTSM